jgi:riboflavin synthase alpha subunit
VAIDGISLTVVNVTDMTGFRSLDPTHIAESRRSDQADMWAIVVNIENDILGKYVDQLLERRLGDVVSISLSPQTIAAVLRFPH